jgi:hypothetical protein
MPQGHRAGSRAVFKVRYGRAAIGEPAVSVRCGHGRHGVLDRQLQGLAGASLGSAHVGLDLRPGELDGRAIGWVRRSVEQPGHAPLHDLTDEGHVLSAQVSPHDEDGCDACQ